MFMKPNAVGTECYNKVYMFQKPAQLWVVNPDGVGTLMGYGIGDTIEVVSPVLETLQCQHEEVDFVVLSDGSKMFKPDVWPDVKQVYLNQPMRPPLKKSEFAGWLIPEDWEPGECKCCCHLFAVLVYHPDPTSLEEDYISCWCKGDCCDHSPRPLGGSRVEKLPEGSNLSDINPTVFRKDCACACHTGDVCCEVIGPCCYDPDSATTDEERDVMYFNYRLWRGLVRN